MMTFKTTCSQTLANKEQRLAYEEAVAACRQAHRALVIISNEFPIYAPGLKDIVTKLGAVIQRADEREAS